MSRRRPGIVTRRRRGAKRRLRQQLETGHLRPTRERRSRHFWDRPPSRPLHILAAIALVAALVAAALRIASPFDHGTWLVAYLFLVGFLAQILLARGQDALRRRARRLPSKTEVRAEAVLWNLGVIAVPLGVLVNARIFVAIGSCVLLAALALFARSLSPSPRHHGAIAAAMAYTALLLVMATSVAIGTGLAWDIPWI